MTRITSLDELYVVIGSIVYSVTGREWWRSTGMQSQPKQPYATIYLGSDQLLQNQVVENIELEPVGDNGEVYEQKSWGATMLDCVVNFYRSGVNDSADEAATRFKNSLYIEERFRDIWEIAGLSGNVRRIDISGMFRADIEPRTEVRFTFMSNVADPGPIDLSSNQIFDIQSQQLDVVHVKPDGSETEFPVNVDSNV